MFPIISADFFPLQFHTKTVSNYPLLALIYWRHSASVSHQEHKYIIKKNSATGFIVQIKQIKDTIKIYAIILLWKWISVIHLYYVLDPEKLCKVQNCQHMSSSNKTYLNIWQIPIKPGKMINDSFHNFNNLNDISYKN